MYPDFKAFVTFIIAEADLVCNLISSCNAVQELAISDNVHKGQINKDFKGSKTIFSAKTTEENLKEPKGDLRQQVECTSCKKTDHHLDACFKFKTEALEKRLKF